MPSESFVFWTVSFKATGNPNPRRRRKQARRLVEDVRCPVYSGSFLRWSCAGARRSPPGLDYRRRVSLRRKAFRYRFRVRRRVPRPAHRRRACAPTFTPWRRIPPDASGIRRPPFRYRGIGSASRIAARCRAFALRMRNRIDEGNAPASVARAARIRGPAAFADPVLRWADRGSARRPNAEPGAGRGLQLSFREKERSERHPAPLSLVMPFVRSPP